MAISRVASTSATVSTGSLSFNAGTSDLVVAIAYRTAGGPLTSPAWNGVSMTQAYTASLPSTNNVYCWYILGGATGTNNFTFSGGNSEVILVSYSGVKQTGFPDASVSITPGSLSSPQTATLTTVANNAWQIITFYTADGTTVTAGSGVTTVLSQITGGGGVYFGDSNGALTPAGSKSQTISFASTATPRSSIFSFSIAPATAPSTPNSGFLMFM